MSQLTETYTEADLPADTGDFAPLPAGWYTADIESSELRETKAGTGKYIAVRYKITGETHVGRVVFGNLNISNPNPKAESIGKQQLGSLMRAIGLASVTDTDQLIGGNCGIKLSVTRSEQYGDGNDVKSWKAIEGAVAPSAPSSPATSDASSAPWAK